MRWLAIATVCVATSMMAARAAQACEPLPCSNYSLSAMTVPQNASALWLRVYPTVDCAPSSALLRRADGSLIDLDVVSDPMVGGPFRWLVPKSAFPAAETATLEATGSCSCDPTTKTRKVAISFGATADLPVATGTPSFAAPQLIDAQQVSLPFCTSGGVVNIDGKAVATDVALTLDAGLRTWAPLLRFRLRVDGAPFDPLLGELQDPFPSLVLYGNGTSGSIKLRVAAHCGPLSAISPPQAKGSWFVGEGTHDVALEATIAGDASHNLTWPSRKVSLICPSVPDAGADASPSADARGDDAASFAARGSGCSTGRPADSCTASLLALCALAWSRRCGLR